MSPRIVKTPMVTKVIKIESRCPLQTEVKVSVRRTEQIYLSLLIRITVRIIIGGFKNYLEFPTIFAEVTFLGQPLQE